MNPADFVVPGIFLAVSAVALRRRTALYPALTDGAMDGLKLLVSIAPSLIILLSAVGMLRASGVMDACARLLAPVFSFFGIPPQTAPLILIRPISGSAALAVGAELMATYGHAGLDGDHLLYHFRLLWRRRHPQNPLRHPRRASGGLHGFFCRLSDHAAVFSLAYRAGLFSRRAEFILYRG